MAIATIKVPSRAHMARGLSACLNAGIEYEMLEEMKVEITCADELKLAKIIVAFGGKIISAVAVKPVKVDLPRHDA